MKNKYPILLAVYILLLSTILVPIVTTSAQQPTPSDDQVNAIARQLYCPVCENTPLDVVSDHSLPPMARINPADAR